MSGMQTRYANEPVSARRSTRSRGWMARGSRADRASASRRRRPRADPPESRRRKRWLKRLRASRRRGRVGSEKSCDRCTCHPGSYPFYSVQYSGVVSFESSDDLAAQHAFRRQSFDELSQSCIHLCALNPSVPVVQTLVSRPTHIRIGELLRDYPMVQCVN